MPIFLILFVILLVACFFIWKHHRDIQLLETVTSRRRGEWSERKTVIKLLKMGIDPRAIFHDCYIRKPNGTYTQVDLVVATSQGLLVFEIKDYSGWIFGDSQNRYWTQVLAYGKEKYRFYNPIMQNNGHIQAIRDNLPHNPSIPIYSIVVFYGTCSLKKVTVGSVNDFIIYPSNIASTMHNIQSRPTAIFSDKHEIITMLSEAVENGTNPEIVSSQLITASMAQHYSTQSPPSYSPNRYAKYRHRKRFH